MTTVDPRFVRQCTGPGPNRPRSFSRIEHLFDAIRQATGNRGERYFLYGHSEGGQFVLRLLMLLPQARVQRAVVVNPG